MKIITEKEYKETQLAYNKVAAKAGFINPYNYARRDGASQRQRSVRGIQRVKTAQKTVYGNPVIRFIEHFVGFAKKR